ncbi:MAG: biotin/lipoyl-binding protein [bacterium]|nr:biotin/lipoyl-binding protein [bacterium]
MTATKRRPAPARDAVRRPARPWRATGAKQAPKVAASAGGDRRREQQPAPLLLNAVGTVEPIESVAVRPQVGGVITRVAFAEGRRRRGGAGLFQIDPRPLQASLAAAQAQLARDEAQAANAEASPTATKLAAKDYVTREQADAARTQAEVFRAAVQADRAAVEQGELKPRLRHRVVAVAGRTGSVLVKKKRGDGERRPAGPWSTSCTRSAWCSPCQGADLRRGCGATRRAAPWPSTRGPRATARASRSRAGWSSWTTPWTAPPGR